MFVDENIQIIASVEIPFLIEPLASKQAVLMHVSDALPPEASVAVHDLDSLPNWWPNDLKDGDYFVEVWSCIGRFEHSIPDLPLGIEATVKEHAMMHRCPSEPISPSPVPPLPSEPSGPSSCTAPMSSAQAVPLIAQAWNDLTGSAPSPALMLCMLSQFRFESGYARPGHPKEWLGSCNWGAVSGVGPAGSFVWQDINPVTGKMVPRKFRKYHNDIEGLKDALKIVKRCHVPDNPSSAYAYARPLRACGYYGTSTGKDGLLISAPATEQEEQSLHYAKAMHNGFDAIRKQVPALPNLPLGGPSDEKLENAIPTIALVGVGVLLGVAVVRSMRGKNV